MLCDLLPFLRIKVNDQIIEVDGKSLVGVTQAYAASVLRGTQGKVSFVIGREKDAENSEIAQLIMQSIQAEKQRESEQQAPYRDLPQSPDPETEPELDENEGEAPAYNFGEEANDEFVCSTKEEKEEIDDIETLKKEVIEWQQKYLQIKDELMKLKEKTETKFSEMQKQLEEVQNQLREKERLLQSYNANCS
ncbi:uncharacterized protein B4U79_13568 [Dinothrombium tinctorium]|uniref:PDZ domain-containing protein n=1 Tax=Dinothrombium tinctorium TaxID=1965070 RepID=A0A3S3PLU0_9ACAR|nr:uncharacterized protein B4U79_01252 [Dinothrombium tinctorium]RWS17979.1 uncharacterized protein B4U79_15568 [Dinothrombium tinctorium]RWS17981.1 uncharacterized protein B4U79_13568 [Dinothrombium tinctorium]